MCHIQTYYTMKRRRGGETLTPRNKLLWHRMHSCPGNVHHKVPRAKIIFNRRVKYGHACYVMYWRSHHGEYLAMKSFTARPRVKTVV